MRKAYYTLDLIEAALLKDYLVQNGVGATLMNKGLVRIPYDGIASEIWIADDANDDEVRALIRGFLKRRKETPIAAKSSWGCQNCREENPGEFEFCWNCGQAPTGSSGASAA
jgi:hypothetical protein